MYRAFIELHIPADNLADAYNRVAILMMTWPKGHWRYAPPTTVDDEPYIGEPHIRPEPRR